MTRTKWLESGQDLLREGGLAAVKLGALTTLADLTTGSFYHHFNGMPRYLDALAEFYGADQVNNYLSDLAGFSAEDRLRRLTTLAESERMRPLDSAMRDWARSNEAAAKGVAAADAALLKFAAKALAELGHTRTESRTRAVMLLSIGTAHVNSPWKLSRLTTKRMREIVIGDPESE